MKDPYLFCYLMGRSVELDAGANKPIVAKVEAGAPLRDVVMDAARAAWAPSPGYKARWFKENRAEIKKAGGDTEKAWRLYAQGRMDAFSHQLEDDILSEIDGDPDEDIEDDEDLDSDDDDDIDEEDLEDEDEDLDEGDEDDIDDEAH